MAGTKQIRMGKVQSMYDYLKIRLQMDEQCVQRYENLNDKELSEYYKGQVDDVIVTMDKMHELFDGDGLVKIELPLLTFERKKTNQ